MADIPNVRLPARSRHRPCVHARQFGHCSTADRPRFALVFDLAQDTKVWVPDPDENVYYAPGKTVKKAGDKYTVLKDSGEVSALRLRCDQGMTDLRFNWDP